MRCVEYYAINTRKLIKIGAFGPYPVSGHDAPAGLRPLPRDLWSRLWYRHPGVYAYTEGCCGRLRTLVRAHARRMIGIYTAYHNTPLLYYMGAS